MAYKGLYHCLRIFFTAAFAVMFAPAIHAQTLNCTAGIIFGEVFSCPAGGTVTVTPSGTRSSTGCLDFGPQPPQPGTCSFFVNPPSVPPDTIQVRVESSSTTISTGSNNLTVNNFNLKTDTGGETYTVDALADDVPIGATLIVPGTANSGFYTGTITVTAEIQ